jgi:DNA-binding CsgD family transcriptional regulator
MSSHDITSRTRPVKIRASARRAQAVKLRLAGLTFREIGQELGIARQSAHQLVRGALDELAAETREDGRRLRALELERLAALQRALWPAAMSGDVASARAATKVIEDRCLLLGLLPAPDLEERAPEPVRQLTRAQQEALGGLPELSDIVERNGGRLEPGSRCSHPERC